VTHSVRRRGLKKKRDLPPMLFIFLFRMGVLKAHQN